MIGIHNAVMLYRALYGWRNAASVSTREIRIGGNNAVIFILRLWVGFFINFCKDWLDGNFLRFYIMVQLKDQRNIFKLKYKGYKKYIKNRF